MKTMTVNEAAKLVKMGKGPAISLYLSTDVSDKEGTAKLRLKLQRLYKSVEALIIRSYDVKTRNRLLQPLRQTLSMLGLKREQGGIGIYHSENFTGIVKLPTVTADLAVHADSFHIKPVLRCLQSRHAYYVLALKKHAADLILVTVDGTKEVGRFPYKPAKDRDALSDRDGKRWSLDGAKLRRQKDLKENMMMLNRQIEVATEAARLPMMVAGSHHHQAAFRDVCFYSNLLERGIDRPVDGLDKDSLTQLSLNVMSFYFNQLDIRAMSSFYKAEKSGLACTDLHQIAKALVIGQVQSLLVAEDRHIWGRLDRETGDIEMLREPGEAPADDLLDDLAELTLQKGGTVTVLPIAKMPQKQMIAAVLRWSDSPIAMPLTHGLMRESWTRWTARDLTA